ncbi:MAG: ATP-binding protein [Deltaproteobacteria bacterium]|nr:ATP-binding protein [Deltaproteobacteria bacterium]
MLKREASFLKDVMKAEIGIFDRSGRPQYLSQQKVKTLISEEVMKVLKNGDNIFKKLGKVDGEDVIIFVKTLKRNDFVLGVLVLSYPLSEIGLESFTLKALIVVYMISISLLFVIYVFIVSRKTYRPVSAIRQLSKKIAQEGLTGDLSFLTTGKLKVDVEEFNVMIDRLRQDLLALSKKINDYRAILKRISDLLLVLDEIGRIKFFNESFKDFIEDEIYEGMYYWELIREPTFNEFYREHTSLIARGEKNISKEIKIKGRHFKLTGSLISPSGERVYLFHDITETVEVERMKRDFIANLSHELRTPLSAIKGFAETLEYDESLKDKTYIDIIKRNTDRLIGIVNDLLLLSKLEEGKSLMEIEELDLKEMIVPITKLFEQKIRQKNLKLIVNVEENLKLKGDRFQLEQLFINLLDNAVKYTDRGHIKVEARKMEDSVEIRVEDSGIGIPEKHQKRIFERFYVVDKSRSKKHNGTGLGLSIVKHIVMLHNGKIYVKSAPGEGSSFIITLPLGI